jgi:predicted DNA-binding transcriptional regulator AlpA
VKENIMPKSASTVAPELPHLVRFEDVWREVGLKTSTVNRLLRDGHPAIPRPIKIAGRRYYPRKVIEDWIESLSCAAMRF